jgi:bifunctional DNase/RNase
MESGGSSVRWLAAAMVTLAALAPAAAAAGVAPKGGLLQVKMTVQAVKLHRGSHVVLLQTDGARKLLPIWIGAREAQAIKLRMAGKRTSRPLTHALLESVLAQLNARVMRVEVDDLRNNVFIGKLTLRDGQGKRHRLDGRPSDLITLAVGAGLPIWVSRHVLDRAGVDPKKKKKGPRGGPTPI